MNKNVGVRYTARGTPYSCSRTRAGLVFSPPTLLVPKALFILRYHAFHKCRLSFARNKVGGLGKTIPLFGVYCLSSCAVSLCDFQELRVCALAALLNLTYHNPAAQAAVAALRVTPTLLAFLDDTECV